MIKTVMSSAVESELGALEINCREAVPAKHTLEEKVHKQPPTPVQTDIITALGVVKKRNEKNHIDGHEASLVILPGDPEPIMPLLVTRGNNQSQLCHKSPCNHPSQSNQTRIFDNNILTRPPKETKSTNKIRSKGVLDRQ